MWKRNLTFVIVCLSGLSGLSAMLLTRERIANPANFDSQRYARSDYRDVIDRVNREFRARWSQHGLQPTGKVDDLLVARRLSLGLLGTLPSLEEIRALERQAPENRLEWWLSRSLSDRRYSDYVAERLARALVGTDQGNFVLFRRRRFVTWLSDQLSANRPYNELVQDLLTAKGLWTDTPAVNFLTATSDANEKGQPDDIKLAGRTARAFLATRIDCLQCHDDKLGVVKLDAGRDGVQADFHQLAAFFSQAEMSQLGLRDADHEYRYKYLGADEESLVEPRPPFLRELLHQGRSRRDQLARWITHPENRPFARATVNRVWAIVCGKPLVEPIDSIPLAGPFPPALETLAEDLVQHGYDLQRLIRLIAACDVFRLDSRGGEQEVSEEQIQAWAAFPLTRLRPDQVAGSMLQSASLSTIDANSHIAFQLARYFQQRDFVERYGDPGEDEFGDQPVTVTQRLLMMNGELVHERTKDNLIANAATRIARLAPDDNKAIETAFLTVLTRRPTPTEIDQFVPRLAGHAGRERGTILEDICWVLINSSEFGWNH